MENRRGRGRVKTRFELLYSAGRTEGNGVLADISYSGARIDGTSFRPKIGARIRLYVFVQPVSPLEITGDVVRHTDDGFAIQYKTISDPELQALIDDAAAIVDSSFALVGQL